MKCTFDSTLKNPYDGNILAGKKALEAPDPLVALLIVLKAGGWWLVCMCDLACHMCECGLGRRFRVGKQPTRNFSPP